MRSDCTGLVLTFNGQAYLDRTLQSLDFCSRLVVVDSGSSDQTVEIARAHGATILTRAWEGTIPQFRYAFGEIGQGWVVTLDQDEWLSAELKMALVQALDAPGDLVGLWCNRSSYYFDRYLRHSGWYPDWLLRGFRLDAVQVRGRLPHEEFYTEGPTRRLPGEIIHHPYADLREHMAKINAYSQAAAESAFAAGKRAGLATALGRGAWKFVQQYLVKQGFRDGRAGLLLAVNAFFYNFHKYARLMELHEQARRAQPPTASPGASQGASPGQSQPHRQP